MEIIRTYDSYVTKPETVELSEALLIRAIQKGILTKDGAVYLRAL